MKDHNICSQYYKDLESGVEMLFHFDTRTGWSVAFINLEEEQDVKFIVPFPKDPEKYKEQIDKFYKDLEEKYQIGGENELPRKHL